MLLGTPSSKLPEAKCVDVESKEFKSYCDDY